MRSQYGQKSTWAVGTTGLVVTSPVTLSIVNPMFEILSEDPRTIRIPGFAGAIIAREWHRRRRSVRLSQQAAAVTRPATAHRPQGREMDTTPAAESNPGLFCR